MTRPNLSFRKIEIRRMPGFPAGGIDVDGLCPGVNIIYGPNASGKTTLSRAIQKLLRPQDPPHEGRSLFASLELHGHSCTIDCDIGRVRFQQDGADVDCPNLAPADVGDRYVLALHDLIRSEDGADLADEIVRESAGGYDVGEAKRALGFKGDPSRSGQVAKNLEAAIKGRREAQNRQDELVAQEATLADLRKRKTEAHDAAGRLRKLEDALAHHEKVERLEEARRKVDAFPDGVGRLAGDEIQSLTKLRERLSTAKDRRGEEQLKSDHARRALDESNLPQEGVPPELVSELRLKCRRLQSLFSEIRTRRQERDEAVAAAEQARRNLGPAVAHEASGPIDLGVVEALSRFARQAERLRAEASAADSLQAWLGPEEESEPENPDALHEASGWLGRWLAAQDASAASPVARKAVPFAIAAAIVVVSLLMSLVHLSWLGLLPLAAVPILWAFWPRHASDARSQYRREFEGMGVGAPASWIHDEVRSFHRQLQERLAQARLRREKAAKWAGLSDRLAALEARRRKGGEERAEWGRRLGFTIEAPETDEAWLYLFAANLNRLQQALARRAGAEAALDRATEEYESLLAEINRAVSCFGFQGAEDPDAAGSRVEQLDQAGQAHRTATKELADGAAALDRIDQEISQWTDEEAALFQRVGLTAEQEATLRQWARVQPDYLKEVDDLRYAERDLESARAALADEPDLLAMSGEALEQERVRCRAAAEQMESIQDQIVRIETAIEAAGASTDLEAALSREIECANAVRELRAQDDDALVGNLLADFLASQQRDQQQPAVFRRARELFVQITHFRYRLDIDPGDPPGFRAFDTSREIGLRLEELSSGTRLQLLLAVRVAFVERQEQGVKLPLILDETLGNSDERRAEQIIDAAIEICRGGRQVFYFTAQHDEAYKWETRLHEHDDVPRKLLDLAEIRRFSESERVPPMDYRPPEPVEVPSPEGLDWLAYGRLLEVPPFDPQRELGGAHLWYLIDDLPTLYRLLKLGVNRWGQFQALADYGHDDSLSTTSEPYRRAEAAARLLESASRHWRIGRGTPLDRQVLSDSKAVSGKFLDRVADLATACSGDARALIAALEAGEVRGFRTDKRNELRGHLIDQGYLDEHDPLTSNEVRERVRPVVFSDMEAGLICPERFERLLGIVLSANSATAGKAGD